MSQDLYQAPDYFLMDELLTNEHKLIRDTMVDLSHQLRTQK